MRKRRPTRKRPNRAFPAIDGYTGAALSQDHFEEDVVREAARLAEKARTYGRRLGSGNFGEAFEVEGHVVKLPTETDIHGRAWPEGQPKGYFLHEAGVANELTRLGHAVVPVTVYVELADGTPALVREYGKVPQTIEGDELAQLENALYAVENEGVGWDVADELLVMRRPAGGLFVADVGWWRKRSKKRGDSYLDKGKIGDLLGRWARAQGLSEETEKALSAGDYFLGAASLELQGIERLLEDLENYDPEEDEIILEMLTEDDLSHLQRNIERREALGLEVPPSIYEVADRALARVQELGGSVAILPRKIPYGKKLRARITKKKRLKKRAEQG